MSTSITTIQSTDLITNSRADINNNFDSLLVNKLEASVLDSDTTLAANSDSKVPTQAAVKAYVDAGGNVNASTTAKGIVEEATQAEVFAGTATGATGARLFINPSTKQVPILIKTSDETVNNSSTLQNDDTFTFSVAANKTYAITAFLRISTNGTADFTCQWSLPASATAHAFAFSTAVGASGEFTEAAPPTLSSVGNYLQITATIIVGATAGTAVLQWAQRVADPSDTKVLAYSWMRYEQLN